MEVETPEQTAAATEVPEGIATLFDNIRALGEPHRRVLVFAGAARAKGVLPILTHLSAHAERQGVPAACVTMARHGACATLTMRGDESSAEGRAETSVDLNGGAAPAALASWLEGAAPAAELILIQGPPLAESIDAALLACGCDGLVVVAEPELTSREDLQLAAKRAQLSGCRTLGVVMSGGPKRVPAWLRRLWTAAGWRPTT